MIWGMISVPGLLCLMLAQSFPDETLNTYLSYKYIHHMCRLTTKFFTVLLSTLYPHSLDHDFAAPHQKVSLLNLS